MASFNWKKEDIPNLAGKEIIITGATGGLGLESAIVLAGAGASVTLTGRNPAKGTEAIDKILSIHPTAKISFLELDLCSLASVSKFAKTVNDSGKAVDILMNNAGVMTPPTRTTTEDGFELQFQTNHLSHFALTGQLLPSLRRSTSGARVVTVSSKASWQGSIYFNDLQLENKMWLHGSTGYGQSKLANLLFTFELQRRSNEGNWGISAIAAHPGISRTDLVGNQIGENSIIGMLWRYTFMQIFSQGSDDGALPQIFAAVSSQAKPGGYYGPNGFFEYYGKDIKDAGIPAAAKDLQTAKKLWEVSEELSGVSWPK